MPDGWVRYITAFGACATAATALFVLAARLRRGARRPTRDEADGVSRRTLLRAILGAAAAPIALTTAAAAAPVAGSTTARTGTWTSLPGSGGLQVHATDASGRTVGVPVTWTADGTVTATWALQLTVTAPTAYAQQAVTSAGGYGLAVRRAG